MGTQAMGTATRTTTLIVAADPLGIPMDAINLFIGDTLYPPSGGSGGSTTPGGVSSSTRRASLDARHALFETVAPALTAQPADLRSENATVRVQSDHSRSLSWQHACTMTGALRLTARGTNS